MVYTCKQATPPHVAAFPPMSTFGPEVTSGASWQNATDTSNTLLVVFVSGT
jgi:hypothetical protein